MLSLIGTVLLELHCGCRKRTAEDFPRWAMGLVQQIIPCNAWFWGSGAAKDGELIAHTALFDNISPETLKIWEQYKHVDVIGARLASQRGCVCNFTHDFLKEHEIYHSFMHQVGIEQVLAIYEDNPEAGVFDAISLYRSDPDTPFSENERTIMQCLAPHLVETRRINYLARMSFNTEQLQHSIAAIDSNGVIHVAEDGFIKLMKSEWPHWFGPLLPLTLINNFGSASPNYVGGVICLGFTPIHDMFLVKARLRTVADGLSKRELEIARYFADGMMHKEIAVKVGLAPATVRNHISSIYLKLAVNNKAELATLLSSSTTE